MTLAESARNRKQTKTLIRIDIARSDRHAAGPGATGKSIARTRRNQGCHEDTKARKKSTKKSFLCVSCPHPALTSAPASAGYRGKYFLAILRRSSFLMNNVETASVKAKTWQKRNFML
jgi:hypothetical protein